ncbi:MAG: hypothetical protein ACTHOD_10300 [Motilibacteraceae bacterium]
MSTPVWPATAPGSGRHGGDRAVPGAAPAVKASAAAERGGWAA